VPAEHAGSRTIAHREGEGVRLLSRRVLDWADNLAPVERSRPHLQVRRSQPTIGGYMQHRTASPLGPNG
jgi:hypothetical protein